MNYYFFTFVCFNLYLLLWFQIHLFSFCFFVSFKSFCTGNGHSALSGGLLSFMVIMFMSVLYCTILFNRFKAIVFSNLLLYKKFHLVMLDTLSLIKNSKVIQSLYNLHFSMSQNIFNTLCHTSSPMLCNFRSLSILILLKYLTQSFPALVLLFYVLFTEEGFISLSLVLLMLELLILDYSKDFQT